MKCAERGIILPPRLRVRGRSLVQKGSVIRDTSLLRKERCPMTTHTAIKTSAWVERVRALAPIVEKWRDAGEQERHMPRPLFEALRDTGVFTMSVPKAVGSVEVEEETIVQVIEEL